MKEKLYPLGTIVYLEDGTQKIMIVGRGVVYNDEDEGKEMLVDYMGCIYPTGIDPEDTIFFNHENIDQVVFEGFRDDEEERFIKVYDKWIKETDTPKKII